MIQIPLEQYPDELAVSVEIEDGQVRLVLDLEVGEIVGTFQQVEDHVEPGDELAIVIQTDDPLILEQQETGKARSKLRQTEAVLAAVQKHRDYLRERLTQVSETGNVWRSLHPEEARAIAAALRHYADEIERRR